MSQHKRPAFPARLDLKSGTPAPARSGLPPLRGTPVAKPPAALAPQPSAQTVPVRPQTASRPSPSSPPPASPAQARPDLARPALARPRPVIAPPRAPGTAALAKPAPLPPSLAPEPPGNGLAGPATAAAPVAASQQQQFRRRMVERLAQEEGIRDTAVLQAMVTVERHRFIDPALQAQAYEDTSLPIGLNQTISKPSVVARMIELLCQGLPAMAQASCGAAPQRHPGRILEIGTGCGYQAAVLGQIAREVYSMERLRGLHEKARENLRPFRLANVHLLLGDGMLGYPKGAPYAGIIAAAGGDAVPQAWIDQLAVGGRLVAPVAVNSGGPGQAQALLVLDKTATGLRRTVLEPVLFVPLKSGIS